MTDTSSTSSPLLSICIPTYNGEAYIGHVLSILLQQSLGLEDLVEIIIADDKSTDRTVEIAAALGGNRIRLIGNSPNLGMGPNIAACMSGHAKGQFVWIWSQHCLLRPGALQRVVETLQSHPRINAFYVNFRCARYPDKWPESVNASYDGPFDYLSNANITTQHLSAWHELLFPATCLCTQTYAHIVRREIVSSYLEKQIIPREFGRAIATFTQTTTTAESFFNEPAVYLGDPIFTIFNGAQTWSQLHTRSLVYFQALPELVAIFRRHGLSGMKLQQAESYASEMAAKIFKELLHAYGLKRSPKVLLYAWQFRRQHKCIATLCGTFFGSDWCTSVRLLRRTTARLKSMQAYLFHQCRPARWYHNRHRRATGSTGN